jgi:ribonuclease R
MTIDLLGVGAEVPATKADVFPGSNLSSTKRSSIRDAGRLLAALLRGRDRPVRLEEARRRLRWSGSDEAFFTAARTLARDKAGLLHNGLLFPPTLLDFRRAQVAHEPNGRFWALLEDGRRLPVSPRAARLVLGGDLVQAALIAPKDVEHDPDVIPVAVLSRDRPRFWGRVVAGEGGRLCAAAERRIDALAIEISDPAGLRPGDIVHAEIDGSGFIGRKTRARVVEVIGHENDPSVESELARRLWELPDGFTAATLAAAAAVSLPDAVEADRQDWRALPFVTVDGASSRDYDDALHGEESGSGWRIRVAIADVAHFVRAGSALDQAGRERLTSVYLPQRTWPMLPEPLSNGVCSLNPGEDRLVLACDMAIGDEGEVRSFRFAKAVIRSAARLVYDDVSAFIDAGTALAAPEAALHSVRALAAAARGLGSAAGRRRLDIHQDALQPVLGADGKLDHVEVESRGSAHRLVEECMLAANLCAARFLHRAGVHAAFRNQPAPDAEGAEALAVTLGGYGIALDAAAVEGAPAAFRGALAGALRSARVLTDYPIIRSAVLEVMRPAAYEPETFGHFSLGEAAYVHFTSPIRRYPDLVTHRVIKAALEGRSPSDEHGAQDLARLCAACTVRAKAASGAEAEARKMLYAGYARRLAAGGRIPATACADSMSERGVYVRLDRLLLEAFVPARVLKAAGWTLEGEGPYWRDAAGGSIRPGDRFASVLAGAETSSRRIDLCPVTTSRT